MKRLLHVHVGSAVLQGVHPRFKSVQRRRMEGAADLQAVSKSGGVHAPARWMSMLYIRPVPIALDLHVRTSRISATGAISEPSPALEPIKPGAAAAPLCPQAVHLSAPAVQLLVGLLPLKSTTALPARLVGHLAVFAAPPPPTPPRSTRRPCSQWTCSWPRGPAELQTRTWRCCASAVMMPDDSACS